MSVQAKLPAEGPLHGETSAWRWGGVTDRGRERPGNEDAIFTDGEFGLFIVSDGMGGHRGGEVASRIVIDELPVLIETRLNQRKSRSVRTVREVIQSSLVEVNRHVFLEGHGEEGHKEMGATVVLVYLHVDRAYVANVGDSRLYRLRNGHLRRVSMDHTVVEYMVDSGLLDPEKADDHCAQGLLTQCVGYDQQAEPHVKSFRLNKADRLLLCSDGLTDMVTEKEIARILSSDAESLEVCGELIKTANANGGHDNISAIVIDWLKGSKMAS